MCNLTDVDDKIIARMTRDGVSLKDLTGKYAQLFFDDLEALNIVPASRYPRATEHIGDIVEMVQVCGRLCVKYVNCMCFFVVANVVLFGLTVEAFQFFQ